MKRVSSFTLLGIIIFTFLYMACSDKKPDEQGDTSSAIAAPPTLNYNIINTYPHDTSSYTQGLIWENNVLYEGTGLEEHSKLMKVDLKTGKSLQSVSIDPAFFGEGITMFNGKIYQLTWQSHKVLVYDAQSLKKIKEFAWEHEGWGLTHNAKELIVSTGESNIYFVDPETFAVKRIIGVMDNNGPVGNINELEYVDGAIYANIYLSDIIIKIDPSNGHILGKIDLTGLLEKAGKIANRDNGLVLNGIAYDTAKKSFYITGKNWPLLFEMKVG